MTDAEPIPRVATRQQTRLALAKRMQDCVSPAPMTFIADPEARILTAELLVRDLLELGWTPPPAPAATPAESCPTRLMDGRNEIRCWGTAGHQGDCK